MVNETEHLRFQDSPIHGLGGFAKTSLPAGTRVIEYVGERISKQVALERCEQGNQFIFVLDDQWDLDGQVSWNPARFLNHSCSPNCDAEYLDGRIWIVARRDLAAGEEITFDYGYDLQDFREHLCRCGAPNCCGYIVSAELRSAVGTGA